MLDDYVARFDLRRKASTQAFAQGTALARRGCVEILEVTDMTFRATVDDGSLYDVNVVVRESGLEGLCTCPVADEDGAVCRHVVAATHALWLRELA